jgi:hypothetical protein
MIQGNARIMDDGPFFSASSCGLSHRRKGGQAPIEILGSFRTIRPIPLGASPSFCDSGFHFKYFSVHHPSIRPDEKRTEI